MRKLTVVLGAVALLAVATPAWAHEEINPRTFPTGKPTFFTLTAANEQKVDLTKVTLTAPSGVAFGETTKEPPGWTVTKADDQITWSGAVKPDQFESWGYEIDSADQPGTLKYKVTLGFADGKSDDVEVDVTAIGGTATTEPASAPGTTAAGGGSEATTPVTVKKSNGGNKANVALGLGAGALVLSVIALALAARKRGGPGGSSGPAAAATGERQDW
jgi:hypothetical protein